MATYVACSYQIEGSKEWEECDEQSFLFEKEEDLLPQIEAAIELLEEDDEDPSSSVTFRYETWVEDDTLELQGDASLWYVIDTTDEYEGSALLETSDSAINYMAESEGIFTVKRLVRTNTYNYRTIPLNKKAI